MTLSGVEEALNILAPLYAALHKLEILAWGRMLAASASELAVGRGNSSAFYWRSETAFCNAPGHGILG